MNKISKLLITIAIIGAVCSSPNIHSREKKRPRARTYIKRALPGAAIGGLTTGLIWGGKWTPLGIAAGGLTSLAIGTAIANDEENQ